MNIGCACDTTAHALDCWVMRPARGTGMRPEHQPALNREIANTLREVADLLRLIEGHLRAGVTEEGT